MNETSGRLVSGTIEPPHRCDPHTLWRELGGQEDDAGDSLAAQGTIIECGCGTRFAYTWLGWRVPTEYPPPGHVTAELMQANQRQERAAKWARRLHLRRHP